MKKERKHTEDLYLTPRRFININYRERSIDDGSHYDPNLDKFENSSRSRSRTQSRSKSVERSASIKNEKKISGLEKVKQLLTGGTLKKKSSNTTTIINNKSKKTPEKEMVKEEEVRARYNEYRATDSAPSLPLTSASGIESKVGGSNNMLLSFVNYLFVFHKKVFTSVYMAHTCTCKSI